MRKNILLIATLYILACSCMAQDEQQIDRNLSVNDPTEPLRLFENAANRHEDGLLFKSQWHTGTSASVYFWLMLTTDGRAFTARIVPNVAVQNMRRGKLSLEQVEEVKRMLADVYSQAPPPHTERESGKRYTALIFFSGSNYERHNYGGSLPVEVQRVVDFVSGEVERQEKLRYEEWLKDNRKEVPSESPTPP